MSGHPADLFDGTPVRLGGRDFIVPALTLRLVRRYEKDMARAFDVGPLSSPEDRALALEIIHAAILRNYPDVTLENMEEWLDLNSTPKVFLAVMGMSGLIRKEGNDQGEAVAGA